MKPTRQQIKEVIAKAYKQMSDDWHKRGYTSSCCGEIEDALVEICDYEIRREKTSILIPEMAYVAERFNPQCTNPNWLWWRGDIEGDKIRVKFMKELNLYYVTDLKREWDKEGHKIIDRAIVKYMGENSFTFNNGKKPISNHIRDIKDSLGLAYTSSSSYAALWVCSSSIVMVKRDRKYKLQGFALSIKDEPVAVWFDDYENELIVRI